MGPQSALGTEPAESHSMPSSSGATSTQSRSHAATGTSADVENPPDPRSSSHSPGGSPQARSVDSIPEEDPGGRKLGKLSLNRWSAAAKALRPSIGAAPTPRSSSGLKWVGRDSLGAGAGKARKPKPGDGERFMEVMRELQKQTSRPLPAKLTPQWTNSGATQRDDKHYMPPYILHPHDLRYRAWLTITLMAAAFTGFFVPWTIGFQDHPGLYPYNDLAAGFNYILFFIFGLDMLLHFRVAIIRDELVISDPQEIARHYLKFWFWVDLVAWVPLGFIVVAALDPHGTDTIAYRYVDLLQLLHMIRLYRCFMFFKFLEYNLTISLLWSTVIRNFAITVFVCNFAACCFYYAARQNQFGPNTWVGENAALLEGKSNVQLYVYAFYWSITTLATVGYGDIHAYSVGEAVFSAAYMYFNLALGAYILGTITLMVIKSDERTGRFRERSNNLKLYSAENNIPQDLKNSMQDHLRLHFHSEEASDEQVLAVYPTTIRRRILRHLYLQPLLACYLFGGCRQKFLDALLSVARVELYMPKVEVLAEGDHVNELFIVLAGLAEVLRAGGADAEDLLLDGNTSVHNPRRLVGPGECFAEAAFFTEVAQLEAVRSVGVTRVLVVLRPAYASVAASFPLGARTVLENLRTNAEQIVQQECQGTHGARALARVSLDLPPEQQQLAFSYASPEMADRLAGEAPSRDPSLRGAASFWDRGGDLGLSPRQELAVGNLLRVRQLVAQHIAKLDEDRVTDFLYACSKDDVPKVRQMLQQGFDANAADYDMRTGLMLACVKGHMAVAHALLAAGANPNAQDAFGGSALLEACKHGHEACIVLLRTHGASLQQDGVALAAMLCSCVFRGDLPQLERLIRAGATVDAGDYDARTATHISAAEGNLAAVRLLVERGGASLEMRDRWGATPLDEARRVGAAPVVAYLGARMAAAG